MKIIADHFSTELDELPISVRDIIKNNVCFSTSCMEDAMLIEVANIGYGPAFRVKIKGLTVDYEEPFFQSIIVGNKSYIIYYTSRDIDFVIKYYNIYSNYYYQRFISENGSVWNSDCIKINTNLPELVLRTRKTRYIQ